MTIWSDLRNLLTNCINNPYKKTNPASETTVTAPTAVTTRSEDSTNMSTLSLPRLIENSTAKSGNGTINRKFTSFRRPKPVPRYTEARKEEIIKDIELKLLKKRNPIQRDGSIAPNQFRGIKREVLERQTSAIIHSLTASTFFTASGRISKEPEVIRKIGELYEEILYEILHNVGCETEDRINQNSQFEYIQDAFKITNDKHEELLRAAKSKEPPKLRLDIECIEGKELRPKDPNGLSDPFITMYLEKNPTHRYNTSVKKETLNPIWQEHFSLPISDNHTDENLVIEVWDFDPAETIKEKFSKISEVKGIAGLRRLGKEIAVAAASGKHENELIGKTNIPLKTIPASGLLMYYNLDKKGKTKPQGSVKIRLNFSSEKNRHVALQEHRHLLRMLLMYHLETSKVAPYWWAGDFNAEGKSILVQHSAQSGLTPVDLAFAQWTEYVAVHHDHPLSFSLFNSILDKITKPIHTGSISEDEMKMFWDAAKRLLPSCLSTIRRIRKKLAGDKMHVKTLTDVLNIIAKISVIEPPAGFDLFPAKIYSWITRPADNVTNCDIQNAIKDAVYTGAANHYEHILSSEIRFDDTPEYKLECLVRVIQLIRSDLQRANEYYDKVFQETVNFHYARTLFVLYEAKLAELIQPIVEEVCRNIKRIEIPQDRNVRLNDVQDINMGTTLFELYLVLKRFLTLGNGLIPGENDFKLNQYHNWFISGVTNWLDISVFKALTRIEKAIELDDLIPVDETVKYSSSAVDTLAIFYQIKIFWQQLAWPDVEGSYMFVGKIVDDICHCCTFYADKMSLRVEGMGDVENVFEKKFEVTPEWCLAINNIDYIRQSLSPFVKEMGVDEIIKNLSDFRSPMEAERCADTLKNVVENAMDTEKNKILELIETVAKKMSPPMKKFLIEGAEFLHQDSNSMDRLMMYLENSLKTLHGELNEVNFERMLDAIWTELASILYDLVQSNLDKRRPPTFFANLRDTLHMMVDNFKVSQNSKDNLSSDRETLDTINRLLELHGYETHDLIHQYYLERWEEQKKTTEVLYGVLTVRCSFDNDNNLEIVVMSARNIIPMDSNGSCDPFVRIHFLPENKFNGIAKPKTQVQNKTLFPLFDEKFVISLSPEQRALKTALILFSVKDRDVFGMSNQYIADCYLRFDEIEKSSNTQLHLTLTKPILTETECLRALEFRQGDKQAKEFIKKLKNKSSA